MEANIQEIVDGLNQTETDLKNALRDSMIGFSAFTSHNRPHILQALNDVQSAIKELIQIR